MFDSLTKTILKSSVSEPSHCFEVIAGEWKTNCFYLLLPFFSSESRWGMELKKIQFVMNWFNEITADLQCISISLQSHRWWGWRYSIDSNTTLRNRFLLLVNAERCDCITIIMLLLFHLSSYQHSEISEIVQYGRAVLIVVDFSCIRSPFTIIIHFSKWNNNNS